MNKQQIALVTMWTLGAFSGLFIALESPSLPEYFLISLLVVIFIRLGERIMK